MKAQTPLTAAEGQVFVQKDLDAVPEYIGCVDMDALPDPSGAITLIRCRDENGDYVTVGETQAEPDTVTTTINARIGPKFDILDRLKGCAFNLYVSQIDCGKRGQFTNWARTDILVHARQTNRTLTNAAMMTASDPTTQALEVTGWNILHLSNKLNIARQSIAETTDLNAIAVDGQTVCAGDCGGAVDAGSVGFIGGDAPAGSPTSTADIWQTDDSGRAWETLTGGATHPFAGGYDIFGAALFAIDRSTSRWLAVREPVVGAPLQVAYSDDKSASWTRVTVGAVNGEGLASAAALFVFDRGNLQVGTSEGNVYQSVDGGATWTLLSASDASGGESLNALRYSDLENGWAAGDADTLIVTHDGGETWTAVTAPTTGANLTSLEAFSPFHVLVGTNKDGLFATFDEGEHWTSKTFTGQSTTGTVKKILGFGDTVVAMIHNPLTGRGYYHRSIDGGTTWERLTTPVNSGLNDFVMVDANNAYIVGNANGGTGFVARVRD